ncbi:YciI family protein [Nocardioides sp.]|uniref:YciI family protein n=1 Tax=Nocardioides sp. TaxID=35761 RepID=UPI00351301C9
MPQYLLSVHHDPTDAADAIHATPEQMERMFAAVGAFNTEVQEAGAWVFAGGLMPIDAASVVDATGESPVVTDGPYSEAKEYLGGFWIIEAADLDAALAWAAKGSAACEGKVEVRPFQGE